MAASEDTPAVAGRPDPISFSIILPRQAYDATVAVRLYAGGPPMVAVDVAIGPAHVASVALGEEAALDVALRLIGAVMRLRGGGS